MELADHPLFGGPELLRRLLARTPARIRTLAREKIVSVQGEPITHLTVVMAGKLSATIVSPSGHTLLVETLGPSDVIAPAMLFSPQPVMPVTLTAITEARLVSLEMQAFGGIARHYPVVYERLLNLIGEKFQFVTTKMRLLHFATLREKVAGYIVERLREAWATSSGGATANEVDLPYGRDRLAELFGVARPSLSRALGGMVDEGVIIVSGRRVEVLKPRELAMIAGAGHHADEPE